MLCSLLQVHYWFIGKLVCYAVYYKYIIDLIGKLVCYAVYYKYIIDLLVS